jgi:hypothetical protein
MPTILRGATNISTVEISTMDRANGAFVKDARHTSIHRTLVRHEGIRGIADRAHAKIVCVMID